MNPLLNIKYTKRFTKQYAKLNPNIRAVFIERQRLWLNDPYAVALHLHMLKGDYARLYSINITGGIRATYEKKSDSFVIFGFIGSHSLLYS
jgi:mRNA-degrading endonuclease YafQ of YafQ-DinJ toxin-antitoxin module